MKTKERRITKRSPIQVLVKCLPPGIEKDRNGHEVQGWDMLARDIAHDGVGLHWSMEWSHRDCKHCAHERLGDPCPKETCHCAHPNHVLKSGQTVHLDGLIYTEEGSVPMQGQIRWIRPGKKPNTYDLGVFVTTPEHRTHFKALEFAHSL